jgi:hypothetical protein
MNAIIKSESSHEIMESVLIKGDLSKLTAEERNSYYRAVCTSVGLNPLTKPLEYITLNGKLRLYALKDCTDQLRSLHKISVTEMTEAERDGVYIVKSKVQNAEGRTDMAIGAVNIAGLKGEALANAMMKTETKSKRRATLSICGLGMLDESEVEDIPRAQVRVPSPSEISHPDNGLSDDKDRARLAAETNVPKHQKPHAIVPEENDTFEKWTSRYLLGLEGATSVAELVEWDNLNDAPLATISNKSKLHYNRIMNRFEELKAKLQRDSISTGPVVPPAPKTETAASTRPDGCPDPKKEPDAFLTWADKRLAPILDAEQIEIVFCEIIDPASEGLEFPPDQEALQAIFAKHQKRLGAD